VNRARRRDARIRSIARLVTAVAWLILALAALNLALTGLLVYVKSGVAVR